MDFEESGCESKTDNFFVTKQEAAANIMEYQNFSVANIIVFHWSVNFISSIPSVYIVPKDEKENKTGSSRFKGKKKIFGFLKLKEYYLKINKKKIKNIMNHAKLDVLLRSAKQQMKLKHCTNI